MILIYSQYNLRWFTYA